MFGPLVKWLPGPNVDAPDCVGWCGFRESDKFGARCLFWILKEQLDEIIELLKTFNPSE